MIPKIIHYCWFGGKPKSEEFNKWVCQEFCVNRFNKQHRIAA